MRLAGRIVSEIGGRTLGARWDPDFETVRVFEGDQELPVSAAFGFVYPALFE